MLIVTQHGAARIYDDGWFGLGYPDAHFRILIHRGRGFERFRRKVLVASGMEPTRPTSIADGRRQEFVLSFDDAIDDVVFPTEGAARIAVEYEDAGFGLVRSRPATVQVVAPEGSEREAYERLRGMEGRGAQFYLELTSDEGAPYVQGARVRSLAANNRRTIAEAETLVVDLKSGQFEPDALAVLAMAYGGYFDRASADAIWQHDRSGF